VHWPILAGLPEEDVRRVLQLARRRVFGPREVVFHRGDPADTLHLVHSGRFAVGINTPLGDTALLSIVGPGDAFGEIALLEPGPRSATVMALERAETRALHKLDVDALRARHPTVGDVLARALAMRVRRLSDMLVEAYYVPAERRVLRRLTELAGESGVVSLTQEELAQMAGTSRATVNRVLRDAQERGELALKRGSVEVLDAGRLAARARRARPRRRGRSAAGEVPGPGLVLPVEGVDRVANQLHRVVVAVGHGQEAREGVVDGRLLAGGGLLPGQRHVTAPGLGRARLPQRADLGLRQLGRLQGSGLRRLDGLLQLLDLGLLRRLERLLQGLDLTLLRLGRLLQGLDLVLLRRLDLAVLRRLGAEDLEARLELLRRGLDGRLRRLLDRAELGRADRGRAPAGGIAGDGGDRLAEAGRRGRGLRRRRSGECGDEDG
jgi:CRP/FNR family cyclic AMP-dependent transcriptional regulator